MDAILATTVTFISPPQSFAIVCQCLTNIFDNQAIAHKARKTSRNRVSQMDKGTVGPFPPDTHFAQLRHSKEIRDLDKERIRSVHPQKEELAVTFCEHPKAITAMDASTPLSLQFRRTKGQQL
ncbi:unnamed protein product [Cylicocyclus nassatus]|uniref:Uncharacterized protein n=1 Tax=Cylicocyclus nassatus TaxID=53992 RepID=A0AA36HBL4_CYLNA|nr:unnamed protein product [Cylicocyclus nassatus]